MSVRDFTEVLAPYAEASEKDTSVPALFSLAQAALETGWGKKVKGNNLFGIKDTDGINGNEIEFLTTEYNKKTGWRKVKQWFRKYDSFKESFDDHGKFFIKNKRYAEAMKHTNDPVEFARLIANAGYATDPDYYNKIVMIMNMIKPYM